MKCSYSGSNQAAIGSKSDKPNTIKKDEIGYSHSARSNVAPVNRGKPQINAQPTTKPIGQTAPVKPVGSNVKPTPIINQSQPLVNINFSFNFCSHTFSGKHERI